MYYNTIPSLTCDFISYSFDDSGVNDNASFQYLSASQYLIVSFEEL